MSTEHIDDIDIKIIEILKRNSRASLNEIAKQIGMSKAAVKKRLDKLVRNQVITRFTIEYKYKDSVQALILVKVEAKTNVPEVAKKISELPMIDHVFEVTGEFDIAVISSPPNINKINDIVDSIRRIEGVLTTNTMIVLRKWL